MNSDGCSEKPARLIQRRAPLTSWPMNSVTNIRMTAITNTISAARRASRGDSERRRQQDADGRDQEGDMALREMEAVEADAFGDRRAAGERQHDAGDHQRQHREQEIFVDRPPPLGEDAAIGPADHHLTSSVASVAASARTSSRKWSPRFSKLRYWSNEAQAGDKQHDRLGVVVRGRIGGSRGDGAVHRPAELVRHAGRRQRCGEGLGGGADQSRPWRSGRKRVRGCRCRRSSPCRRGSRRCASKLASALSARVGVGRLRNR